MSHVTNAFERCQSIKQIHVIRHAQLAYQFALLFAEVKLHLQRVPPVPESGSQSEDKSVRGNPFGLRQEVFGWELG
jgi:hypothetical protein